MVQYQGLYQELHSDRSAVLHFPRGVWTSITDAHSVWFTVYKYIYFLPANWSANSLSGAANGKAITAVRCLRRAGPSHRKRSPAVDSCPGKEISCWATLGGFVGLEEGLLELCAALILFIKVRWLPRSRRKRRTTETESRKVLNRIAGWPWSVQK